MRNFIKLLVLASLSMSAAAQTAKLGTNDCRLEISDGNGKRIDQSYVLYPEKTPSGTVASMGISSQKLHISASLFAKVETSSLSVYLNAGRAFQLYSSASLTNALDRDGYALLLDVTGVYTKPFEDKALDENDIVRVKLACRPL